MGMPGCPKGLIRNQQFFSSIDWEKIEKREIEPPFKPKIVSATHRQRSFSYRTLIMSPWLCQQGVE